MHVLSTNITDAKELGGFSGCRATASVPENVAKVKHLSPFRYPGGKTWLISDLRQWILSLGSKPTVFVEPFAGGGMASLTVASENLAHKVVMGELDADVSAVWQLIFNGEEADMVWLYRRILKFEVNLENVKGVIASKPRTLKAIAFRTIIKNRMQRGGIMAPGAGLINSGDNGRGLLSRWYPETLVKRMQALRQLRDLVSFQQLDAFETIARYRLNSGAFFFIDPPYTAGGKNAGKRLYSHNEIDHERLFHRISKVNGLAVLTYDDCEDVRFLAEKYGFTIQHAMMKNTHHEVKRELLILKIR